MVDGKVADIVRFVVAHGQTFPVSADGSPKGEKVDGSKRQVLYCPSSRSGILLFVSLYIIVDWAFDFISFVLPASPRNLLNEPEAYLNRHKLGKEDSK